MRRVKGIQEETEIVDQESLSGREGGLAPAPVV